MAFRRSNDLVAFAVRNTLFCYDLKNSKIICQYSHEQSSPTAKPESDEPVKKKKKPCESRVDNTDIIDFAIRHGGDSQEAEFAVIYNDKVAKKLKLTNRSNIDVTASYTVEKRPTSIAYETFGSNYDIVYADKAGDAYRLDTSNADLQKFTCTKTPLLGHISMLLGVALSEKYIFTAERDEKIKVSLRKLPYVIHGYLLGHTQFVRDVFSLSDQRLLSFGGDLTLRLWDVDSCTEVDRYDLPKTTIRVFQESATKFTAITTSKDKISIVLNEDKLYAYSNTIQSFGCIPLADTTITASQVAQIPEDFLYNDKIDSEFKKLFKNTDFKDHCTKSMVPE